MPLIAGVVCPNLILSDETGIAHEICSYWEGAREGAAFFLYPKANTGG